VPARGAPRGGSIGLIRAAWKSARWRASEQPPAPCQIRRSIGAEQAGQCPLRTLTAGNPRRFSVKIGLTVNDVGLGLMLPEGRLSRLPLNHLDD
jgi:hypothetical protein